MLRHSTGKPTIGDSKEVFLKSIEHHNIPSDKQWAVDLIWKSLTLTKPSGEGLFDMKRVANELAIALTSLQLEKNSKLL